MHFTLIVCTYMRPKPLLKLLQSVLKQTLYPNDILIIDGSTNEKTEAILKENIFSNLRYFKVDETERGLTKQRNFGISKIAEESEIICFLDDDIVLEPAYFENLIKTYSEKPDALAVGGYITNEVTWEASDDRNHPSTFYYDGWMRNESLRFRLRKLFGLQPDMPPGFLPTFGNARPISYLPPSNKIYAVEFFMGGVSSYRRDLFNKIKFSNYFAGYGLYEDLDFCLRVANIGTLYLNTKARLKHFHEAHGRPNQYKYGIMVVRNGWYVWKLKYPNAELISKLKFHFTFMLLTAICFTNSFYGTNKKKSFMETLGRFVGWFSLFFNKPKIQP
ncbi:glycosyltransferase family 2 protein [Mariniflexile sp. HNIBRBA6329]|uniref:glycosyltransferase family 2 protein n=1 Tax=Mariniflexile sp. HNIBRBA6329 TaxID=3373088 RepID=UPI0037455FAB